MKLKAQQDANDLAALLREVMTDEQEDYEDELYGH